MRKHWVDWIDRTDTSFLGHCLGSVVGWCEVRWRRSTLVRVYRSTGACWLDETTRCNLSFCEACTYLWAEEHGFFVTVVTFSTG
jgi:hypothetical protein